LYPNSAIAAIDLAAAESYMQQTLPLCNLRALMERGWRKFTCELDHG
jgi:hypothetical protein